MKKMPKGVYKHKCKPAIDRLTKNTEMMPNGCLEWQGAKDKKGYGRAYFKGKQRLAHRVAWILANGEIPEGMHVCHKCDNPPCCNVDHLFLGAQTDNMRDMVAKGRSAHNRGESSGSAKLNADQVREIRAELGMQKDIAKRYGIRQCTVSAIKRGRAWSHLV